MATTNTTATNKKVTKAQRFEDIKALLLGDAVQYGTDIDTALTFIDHELGLLAKKNSGTDKKQTALQQENSAYKELIKTYLLTHSNVTVTEIMKGIPELSDLSNQRVARMCTDLVNADVLVKTIEKGKSLFSLSDTAFQNEELVLEPSENQ